LEKRLARNIETINAGVNGYSPWQQYIYLSREGLKYEPDVIVVAFVLNDVTEKFGLIRFGGRYEGAQLAVTAPSSLERLYAESSIAHFARRMSARIRFGSDVQKGAIRAENLNVKALAYQPDRPDVRKAWEITLAELGKIFDLGQEKDIPVILVVLPYTFQFDDVEKLSAPQQVLNDYAVEKGVPVLDLLPLLAQRMERQGLKPEDYFLDTNHLSPLGSEVVAEIIAAFIQQQELAAPWQD
jgi:lysophospholipase L1-like esterase